MKKKFAMAFLALTVAMSARSAEVSRDQAVSIAREKVGGDVESVQAVSHEGQKAYYVVQFRQGGWVLVSADDCSMPVIGYSPDGIYQTEGQPENVRGMMAQYGEQIIRNKRLGGQPHALWRADTRAAKARAQADASGKIAPLITVNWNQTGSYKKYCPQDAKGQAVVGCVAVGMAQAMSVARWPARPVGNHGYTHDTYGSIYIDYDKEPDYDWNAILTGANGRDDVARLLWHCGVAVNMDYGVDGSGTQTSLVPNALKTYFGYPPSVKFYSRKNYDGDWAELILNELTEGRAVTYSGADPVKSYGHCFNLDGYDGSFFHVNWGWGGTNNGYFGLDGLKDATMDMNYTESQGVVVGIRQPSDMPSNIDLSCRVVQAGQPAGTVVGDVLVESEAANPVYRYELRGKYSARLHKYLDAPFEVVDNQLLTTEVLPVGTQTVTITATNTQNLGSVERTFNITVTADATAISEVYPGGTVSRRCYSLSGERLSAPRRGVNIISTVQPDGTTKSIKILK